MTTYNTYQEAKIANPDSEIYQLERNGAFAHCDYHKAELVRFVEFDSTGIKCNPADYCMTVEKFLADGYKFVNGDWFINYGELVVNVGRGTLSVAVANAKQRGDSRSYILRAAALEEKKPRTKVEYEKWNFECAWHAIKAFEDGERIYTKRSHKDYILIDNAPDVLRFLYDLHERIETPITWQEELYDYLDSSCEMSDDFDDSFTIGIEGKPLEFNLNDDEFVDMCKLVASLNSVN